MVAGLSRQFPFIRGRQKTSGQQARSLQYDIAHTFEARQRRGWAKGGADDLGDDLGDNKMRQSKKTYVRQKMTRMSEFESDTYIRERVRCSNSSFLPQHKLSHDLLDFF